MLVHSIVQTKYFEMAVMAVILMSSIALAAENPVDEKSHFNNILQYFDYCFTGVFTVEMILKVYHFLIFSLVNAVSFHMTSYSNLRSIQIL